MIRDGHERPGRGVAAAGGHPARVREWIVEYGEGPSARQIATRVGLASTSSVAYHLVRLEELGLISRTGRHWRTRRLNP
ncbi:hypothetical protein [Streptomyces sp. NPDC005547]|uniref:LexA family protein n=1 Tax=Streptomyces sp. NPDC005547 TaxID=3154887 RepID=UPI0033B91AC5